MLGTLVLLPTSAFSQSFDECDEALTEALQVAALFDGPTEVSCRHDRSGNFALFIVDDPGDELAVLWQAPDAGEHSVTCFVRLEIDADLVVTASGPIKGLEVALWRKRVRELCSLLLE